MPVETGNFLFSPTWLLIFQLRGMHGGWGRMVGHAGIASPMLGCIYKTLFC